MTPLLRPCSASSPCPKWDSQPDCTGAKAAVARLAIWLDVPWPAPDTTERVIRGDPALATRQVEIGGLGSAANTLRATARPVASTDEVVRELLDKHPDGPDEAFPDDAGPTNVSPPTLEFIRGIARDFNIDTSPGISGWTVPLLRLVISSEEIGDFLHLLTATIAQGIAPG